jgi:hypothetical protein
LKLFLDSEAPVLRIQEEPKAVPESLSSVKKKFKFERPYKSGRSQKRDVPLL